MYSSQKDISCISATATSLRIQWSDIQCPEEEFEGYEIKGKCNSDDSFKTFGKKIKETEFTLRNLKTNTCYEIRIYSVIDGDATKLYTIKANTKPSLIPSLIQHSMLLWEKPKIYKLEPFKRIQYTEELRELHMFLEYKPLPIFKSTMNEKTILFVGSTGSGKSTLVDAMINYVVDVPFRDDCRFRMVDLTDVETKNSKSQVSSQTSVVTCYRIPSKEGFNTDFQLNIIDTPGFGDTRGKEFDKRIRNMIETLFQQSITTLDAVCIVLPLSSNRLTEAQGQVFSNIVGLFAKNIEKNIFAMITNDDGGDPQCLNALKTAGIPVKEYFRFNNSDVFSTNPSEKLWNNRAENFVKFFKLLENVEKQCLKDSIQVHTTQARLRVQLERVQDSIRIQVQTINNIRNESRVMEKYKIEIETNKDFKYTEIECVHELTYSRERCLNCPECKTTCHTGCWVFADFLIPSCESMQKSKCVICKKKCDSSVHKREYNKYVLKNVEVIKTKEDLEQKYKCAVAEKEKHTSLLEKEKLSLKQSLEELDSMLSQVSEWIRQLNKIALKSENRTIQTFLQELIVIESTAQQPQFEQRIDTIKRMKENLEQNKKLVDSMSELLQIK